MKPIAFKKQEIKKWAFIGGAPRSGTSLLQAILNEHSQCVSPPESHILETYVYAPTSHFERKFSDQKQLIELLRKDKWIHRLGIDPEEIVRNLPDVAHPLTLFKLFMQQYASGTSKEVLVDGCPINIWYLKKLNVDFPGCYILHIVRDPRDVVMSTMNAEYTKSFDFPLTQIAKQFMESYLQSKRFAHLYENRYLKIYYEDLILSPEKVIRNVCKCLDINFEETMLDFHKSSQKVSSEEEVWKGNLSRPFLKDNFGKWKTAMKPEDIMLIEYICKRFFEIENQHYLLSEIKSIGGLLKKFTTLASYRFSEIKKQLRKQINGRRTTTQLDAMPPYERLRANGFLKV